MFYRIHRIKTDGDKATATAFNEWGEEKRFDLSRSDRAVSAFLRNEPVIIQTVGNGAK